MRMASGMLFLKLIPQGLRASMIFKPVMVQNPIQDPTGFCGQDPTGSCIIDHTGSHPGS